MAQHKTTHLNIINDLKLWDQFNWLLDLGLRETSGIILSNMYQVLYEVTNKKEIK